MDGQTNKSIMDSNILLQEIIGLLVVMMPRLSSVLVAIVAVCPHELRFSKAPL